VKILNWALVLLLLAGTFSAFSIFFGFQKNKSRLEVEGGLPSISILDSRAREKAVFFVEIAKTVAERTKGLMFRESLAMDQGMLFVFPDEAKRWFWMKNTRIPLDMIFCNQDGMIVGLIKEAEANSKSVFTVDIESMYILEVNAGLVEKYGIKEGDMLTDLSGF